MDNVSMRVKEAREAKGLTIEDLSKATLLPNSIIKDIEAGKFDKYKGDELYVKNYLKKLSAALDIDGEDLTREYIALTEEIRLQELQNKKAQQTVVTRKDDTLIEKLGDTFKSVSIPKPTKKHKHVYGDRYIFRYLKIALVVLVIVALLLVLWYSIISITSGSDNNFDNEPKSSIDGNVTDNIDDEQPETTVTPVPVVNPVEITKNNPMDYTVKLNDDSETFELKIEFVGRTWASMQVNNESYSEFSSRIYNRANSSNRSDATPETVTVNFNKQQFTDLYLDLGYNRGHRFYINNVQVEIDPADYSDQYPYFRLALVK